MYCRILYTALKAKILFIDDMLRRYKKAFSDLTKTIINFINWLFFTFY